MSADTDPSHREADRVVREANTRFYAAFEALQIEQMDEVWAHDDAVRCVHPGWQCLRGWAAVRRSWEELFKNTRYMEFNLTEVDVWVDASLATVFCHENIVTFREGKVVRTVMLATNLFRRLGDRWLLIHHHGSPVLGPVAESGGQ